MALTPLEVQKMRFPTKFRGADPVEVENFLSLVAEELATRATQVDQLERENRYFRQRIEEAGQREHQLQQTLLQAQKVSDEITSNARREAEITVREGEQQADRMVQLAIEQCARIEARIAEMRALRRELQVKFKNNLDLFQRVLESEIEDERSTASVSTLQRRRREAAG
jgi:cell division initiation protein